MPAKKQDNKTNGNESLRATLLAQTNKEEKGFGYVWGQSTHAIGETFGAIGELATTGRQLAKKGKAAAVASRIESSQEICGLLNIETDNAMDDLLTAEAIVDYICSKR